MTYKLGSRSKERIAPLHPDLQAVVNLAITKTEVDFTVLEGMRTKARQRRLVASGASKTMNSRHLNGHAVDLGAYVGGKVVWTWPEYHKIADAMKAASKELGIPITCGADWKNFPDGPHVELQWEAYPSRK